MMTKTLEIFQKRIPLYRKNIKLFAWEMFKFIPDKWQDDVFCDIVTDNRITVKSGQGVGKTAITAIILLWFLSCFSYPRIVATAPTKQQLNDVLWSEVAKWQEKSPVLKKILKWTKTYVYMKGHDKRWFAVAKTATKPENMQGFHEDNMLFIVDEASGVADTIMEAILGTLSGENNKLLMLGNPTKTSGVFYDSHTVDRALYKCHTVNSENVARVNKKNIENLKKKYGEDSNVVRVRVYGEFPTQEDDVFIPLSIIEQCSSKLYELPDSNKSPNIILGVDIARFGNDETIIYRNAQGRLKIMAERKGQDLMATAGDVIRIYKKTINEFPEYRGKIYVNIDDTGLGGGVTDRLKEVKKEQQLYRLAVVPINAAEKIETDTKAGKEAAEYYNDLTTHMWACLKELIEHKEIELEDDADTVAQLSTRKYRIASNGKIEIEGKDEMKKRGLKSPDRGDAAALSVYLGKIKKYTGSMPNISDGLKKESEWMMR